VVIVEENAVFFTGFSLIKFPHIAKTQLLSAVDRLK